MTESLKHVVRGVVVGMQPAREGTDVQITVGSPHNSAIKGLIVLSQEVAHQVVYGAEATLTLRARTQPPAAGARVTPLYEDDEDDGRGVIG